MSESAQLAFPLLDDDERWQRMLDEIRGICSAPRNGGKKQVSWDLKIAGPDLSNMLAENNRSELKLRFLPYFLRHRLNDELPRLIVEGCGLTLGEAMRPLTAVEELALLKEACARAGAAGAAIVDDAHSRRR